MQSIFNLKKKTLKCFIVSVSKHEDVIFNQI